MALRFSALLFAFALIGNPLIATGQSESTRPFRLGNAVLPKLKLIDFDKMCGSNGATALAAIENDLRYTKWDFTFHTWLEKRKLDGALKTYKAFGLQNDLRASHAALKAEFILSQFGDDPSSELKFLAQTYLHYELLNLVKTRGLRSLIPTELTNADRSKRIPFPHALDEPACLYVRDQILVEISDSPLNIALDSLERKAIVDQLDAASPHFRNLHKTALAKTIAEWETISEGFVSHYRTTYDWYQFLESLRDGVPSNPAWKKAIGNDAFYREFIANELDQAGQLLGNEAQLFNSHYDYSRLGEIIALTPPSPLNTENLHLMLSRDFERALFLKDKRVRDAGHAFLELYARHWLRKNPHQIEQDVSRRKTVMNAENKLLSWAMGTMREIRHPGLLEQLLDIASVEWTQFGLPEWVRNVLEKRKTLEKNDLDVMDAWLGPSRSAMGVVFDNLTIYSDVEHERILSWCGNEIFKIERFCRGDQVGLCKDPSSYEAGLVLEYRNKIKELYVKTEAMASARKTFGLNAPEYMQPDFQSVDWATKKATQHMIPFSLQMFGPRAFWGVVDHPLETALFVGSLILAPYYASMSATCWVMRGATLAARSVVWLAKPEVFMAVTGTIISWQAARIGIGYFFPENPFGFSGLRATEAWISLWEQLSIILSFPAFVGIGRLYRQMEIGELLEAYRELGPHYRAFGLRPGARWGEVQTVGRMVLTKLHPDRIPKNIDPIERMKIEKAFVEASKNYEALRLGYQKYPGLNGDSWMKNFFREAFDLLKMNRSVTAADGKPVPAEILGPSF